MTSITKTTSTRNMEITTEATTMSKTTPTRNTTRMAIIRKDIKEIWVNIIMGIVSDSIRDTMMLLNMLIITPIAKIMVRKVVILKVKSGSMKCSKYGFFGLDMD